ncbi:MAG: 50S ribosomal protein L7/L12 [bacterium]|jgi:large subunit ribosomal protein L7/L12
MASTVEQIVDLISKMTVLELSELKKAMEDTFGVTAAAPVAVGVGAGAAEAAPVEEEKTSFDAVLSSVGDQKLQVIKVVRELTSLGLKEAKDLVDGAPQPVKTGVSKEEAETIATKLAAVGAKVDIK